MSHPVLVLIGVHDSPGHFPDMGSCITLQRSPAPHLSSPAIFLHPQRFSLQPSVSAGSKEFSSVRRRPMRPSGVLCLAVRACLRGQRVLGPAAWWLETAGAALRVGLIPIPERRAQGTCLNLFDERIHQVPKVIASPQTMFLRKGIHMRKNQPCKGLVVDALELSSTWCYH